MPHSQQIPGYIGRSFLINGVGVVFFFFFAGLIAYAAKHGGGTELWVGIGGMVASGVATIVVQAVRAQRFHCPKCGQIIPRYIPAGTFSHRIGRSPVRFLCSHCDILWNTGLRA